MAGKKKFLPDSESVSATVEILISLPVKRSPENHGASLLPAFDGASRRDASPDVQAQQP